MAGLIRDMLDCLSNDALRGLCEARGLLLSGTKNERAGRLAKSFRGEAAPLIELLRRQDMVEILSQWEFSLEDGRWGDLVGVSNAAKDDLERWMTKVFVDDWDPSPSQLQPFRNSSISIDWQAADEDEDDDDDDDLEDDDEDEEAADDDEDAASSHLDSTEQFWQWLRGKLQDRGASTMLVKTMVNQLGHHRAHQRLRGDAVRELAAVLAAGGFQTVPDLGSMESSPGIEFRVRVFRRGTQPDTLPHVREDWQPIPKIAPAPRDARPPVPVAPKSAMATDFERGAAKLRFLVTVAASIARPSDDVRNRAIEESARELSVSPADRIRLRALAHQYASGHEDLTASIAQLRVGLREEERRSLLTALRALAPATTELEELISSYAAELGVPTFSVVPTATTPISPETPRSAAVAADRANPALDTVLGEEQPTQAGGDRQNAALDDIFSS